MGGLLFYFKWVLGFTFQLLFCGICLWVLIWFLAAVAFGRRNPRPAARASLACRVLLFLGFVAFCTFLVHAPLAHRLGDLVGGTTNSGYAGLGEDAVYYLYAWWKPGEHTAVSPEKYWTLYWCEYLPLYEVMVAVPLFALAMLLWRWEVGRKNLPGGDDLDDIAATVAGTDRGKPGGAGGQPG